MADQNNCTSRLPCGEQVRGAEYDKYLALPLVFAEQTVFPLGVAGAARSEHIRSGPGLRPRVGPRLAGPRLGGPRVGPRLLEAPTPGIMPKLSSA